MQRTHPTDKSDTGTGSPYDYSHVELSAFVVDGDLEIDAIADPTEKGGLAAARIAADDLDFERIGQLFDSEKFDGQEFSSPNAQWIAQARVNLGEESVTAIEFNGELLADDAAGDAHNFRMTTVVVR